MKQRPRVLNDPRAEEVLERLHRAAGRQIPWFVLRNLHQLPSLFAGRGIRFDRISTPFLDDKFISIGPDQGEFLYLLARGIGARNIVEFGMSFGVSTIYLACAARDNGGRVITTELLPSKIERARANLEAAGVADYVEIRQGDALETLATLDQSVDLALLDGFPNLALDVLRVIEPRLRLGAAVLVDDVNLFKQELQPLVQYTQDPLNGYRSSILGVDDGFFMAVRSTGARPAAATG